MPSDALRDRIPYLIGVLACAGALLVGYGWQADRLPVPECGFLRFTGYPCAFCGTTRSFFLIAKGNVGDAAREAPLGVLVYVAVVATLVWCLIRSIQPRTGTTGQGGVQWARVGIYGAILAAIANWVYRLVMGLK